MNQLFFFFFQYTVGPVSPEQEAGGTCDISSQLLKARDVTRTHGLHEVYTAVWQSGAIPLTGKRVHICCTCRFAANC